MSENKEKDPKKQFKDLKEKFTGNKNNNDPKKPFNFYWIYAIIGVILISLNLFQWNGSMTDIDPSQFEEMVKAGDVQKVIIYNKEVAEVFLKKEVVSQERHKSKIKKPIFSGAENNGPHYRFNIGPPEAFQTKLDAWKQQYGLGYDYKEKSTIGQEILSYVMSRK